MPAPRRWLVYILRCGDGSLYTGATNDLARRLAAHGAGRGARYTRSRLPVSLVYEERRPDRASALRREAAVKRLSRSEKLDLVAVRSSARGRAARAGKGSRRSPGRQAQPAGRGIR